MSAESSGYCHLHWLCAALGSPSSPQQQRLALPSNLLNVPSQAHLRLRQAAERAAELLLQQLRIAFVSLLHTSRALTRRPDTIPGWRIIGSCSKLS